MYGLRPYMYLGSFEVNCSLSRIFLIIQLTWLAHSEVFWLSLHVNTYCSIYTMLHQLRRDQILSDESSLPAQDLRNTVVNELEILFFVRIGESFTIFSSSFHSFFGQDKGTRTLFGFFLIFSHKIISTRRPEGHQPIRLSYHCTPTCN